MNSDVESIHLKMPVWSGIFATAASAAAQISEHERLFELKTWLQRQHALARSTAEHFRHSRGCEGARPSTLPLIMAASSANEVVDLGGGSGWAYLLLEGLGIAPSRYIVLELPAVVNYFEQHSRTGVEYREVGAPVSFSRGHVDVMYANSALQYMPDNEPLMQQVIKLQPRLLLIDELLWTSGNVDWFTIQRNSDVSVVARFASLSALEEQLANLGMRRMWTGAFGVGHLGYCFPEMSNFPSHLAIDHAKALLFIRGE